MLACLRAVTLTEAELLVGARAVAFNPHFLHYCSPSANDIALGAVDQWPPVPALLLLDSFEPLLGAGSYSKLQIIQRRFGSSGKTSLQILLRQTGK